MSPFRLWRAYRDYKHAVVALKEAMKTTSTSTRILNGLLLAAQMLDQFGDLVPAKHKGWVAVALTIIHAISMQIAQESPSAAQSEQIKTLTSLNQEEK